MCVEFTGSSLRLVCIWRARGKWGGRVGQRVWGYTTAVGTLWPLGSQSWSHRDLPSLETHERLFGAGRTGCQRLWGVILGVEVRTLLHFLFSWTHMSYFSSVNSTFSFLFVPHEKLRENVYVCSSRVYQMSKLYIFSPSSGLYTCPLAMTDGAAKVIQVCHANKVL